MHGGYGPGPGMGGPGGQMMGPGDPSKGGMMMGGPPRPSISPAGPFSGPGMQGMQQQPGPNGPMGPMSGGMPRMMGPGGGRAPGPSSGGPFNGANVQVKASAPNTIQYLPARPQTTAPSPRGPPSLEFLQRFTGPMSGYMDGGKPRGGQNMQFFNSGNGGGGPHSGMGGKPMNMGGSNGPDMGQQPGMGGPMCNMNMGGMGPGGPMNCPSGGPNGNMMNNPREHKLTTNNSGGDPKMQPGNTNEPSGNFTTTHFIHI